MSQDWVKDVWEFRKACNLPVSVVPQMLPMSRIELHLKCLVEEIEELKLAIYENSAEGIADAYADLIYYGIGHALEHGLDLRPVWDAVHKANMKKTTGPKREDGKQLKPPDWVPPDIKSALEESRLPEL